jgi:hypothetical protein
MRDVKAAFAKKCSSSIGLDDVATGAIPATKYKKTPATRTRTPVMAPKKKVLTKAFHAPLRLRLVIAGSASQCFLNRLPFALLHQTEELLS